jgi:putative transposase
MELRLQYGVHVGRKRVARLMRHAGLKGVQKRRFRCTTCPGKPEQYAPDLVQRHFTANRPNALWLADVTYIPTDEGWLYLAAILDVFSRYVVGWVMAERLASTLVLQALDMALGQSSRGGDSPLGPRERIHSGGLLRPLSRARDNALHGHRRRLLRQCDDGIALFQPRG